MDFWYYSLRSVFILDVDIILKQKSPKIRLRHDVFALNERISEFEAWL